MEIISLVVILIAAYLLSQWGVMWRTKRTCMTIIKDLDGRRAHSPASAVALPYAQKKGMFHIGLRDYKPQALQYLIHREIVGTTDDGRFYLAGSAQEARNIQL